MSWWSKYSLSQMEEMMDFLFQQSQGGGSSASLIHQASVTLTHASILAAVDTSPVIVPATSGVLDYEGLPDKLFIPIAATEIWDFAQAYTHFSASETYLAWGSDDFSVQISSPLAAFANAAAFNLREVFPPTIAVNSGLNVDGGLPLTAIKDNLYDNAIILHVSDDGSPVSDGHADNTWTLALLFKVYDFTQKKFLTTAESVWNELTRTFD